MYKKVTEVCISSSPAVSANCSLSVRHLFSSHISSKMPPHLRFKTHWSICNCANWVLHHRFHSTTRYVSVGGVQRMIGNIVSLIPALWFTAGEKTYTFCPGRSLKAIIDNIVTLLPPQYLETDDIATSMVSKQLNE